MISFTLHFKVLFMSVSQQPIDTLKDIKNMMEKSSRFISLSGWSGIAAGFCALTGAFFANRIIHSGNHTIDGRSYDGRIGYADKDNISLQDFMGNRLFIIALLTLIAAFVLAFFFTYLRSKKKNVAIWSVASRRLMINVSIPMIAGGIYMLKLIESGMYGLIAPGCLIFYGLALLNGSKYTLGEIRYLGYCEIILGLINCWYPGLGIYFWTVGFGFLHIIYGIVMWNRYERNAA